jgi:quinol monooxygenase YgiN
MIIVHAKQSVIPEKKAELIKLAKGLMAATQKEEGCVSYVLYDNPNDPGSCMFVEEWTDIAALKRHLTTPHIAEWRQQSAPLLSAKTVIKIYEGAETTL